MNTFAAIGEIAADNKNLPFLVAFSILFPCIMCMVGWVARDVIAAIPRRIFRKE